MIDETMLSILITVIGTAGVVLAAAAPSYFAMRGRVKDAALDAAAARVASERAEQSMNNSPHTITERLLAIAASLDKVIVTQGEHGKDVRGLREDIGILHSADRILRADFTAHLQASSEAVRNAEATATALARLIIENERRPTT